MPLILSEFNANFIVSEIGSGSQVNHECPQSISLIIAVFLKFGHFILNFNQIISYLFHFQIDEIDLFGEIANNEGNILLIHF